MDKKNIVIIILSIIVVILAAALVVVLVNGNNNNKTIEEEEEEPRVSSKIKIQLETMCSNVNSRGEYDGGEIGYCEEFICKYEDDNYSYSLDCRGNKPKVEKSKKSSSTSSVINANIILSTACSNLNSRGNYEYENVSCEDYVCEAVINGRTYTRDCNVK